MGKRAIAILLLISLASCATTPARGDAALEAVRNFLAALNRRDTLALTAYVTPDVEWYSIIDGERVLEVAGREALQQALMQFVANHADARWSIVSAQSLSNRLAVTERSEWSERGRKEVRDSLGVYELTDGRIRRMTYFLTGE